MNRRAKRFIQREHDHALGTRCQRRQRHRSVVGIGRLLHRVTRQQQRHRRPLPDDAFDRGAATRMLRKPPHHAQAEARAAALAFGRKERLEHTGERLRRDAAAGIAHADGHVPPAAREPAQRRLLVRHVGGCDLDRDAPFALDGIASIHGQIDDDTLELRNARAHCADILLQRRLERDARPQRTAQQRQQVADDFARIDGADVEVLAPRKRHELLDQVGAALTGVACCLELLEHARSLTHLFADQVEIADEHGQQIVEVVRDSGRQAAERFHAGSCVALRPAAPCCRRRRRTVRVFAGRHPRLAATDRRERRASYRRTRAARCSTTRPARGTSRQASPSAWLDQLLDEALARCRLSIADAEEAPHTCVRADDVAIEIDDDRSDHAARFQNREVEVGGLPYDLPPTRWLRHQLVSGNTVGTAPKQLVYRQANYWPTLRY